MRNLLDTAFKFAPGELHGGAIGAEFPEHGGTRIVARLPVRLEASLPLEAGLG